MSARVRAAARQVLGGVILFAAMAVFGLVTRPIALALPGFYGFHAVLVALPSAWAITLCLRRGICLPTCFLAVALFSGMLFAMSPIMGLSSLIPMIGAVLAFLVVGRWSPAKKAWAAGMAYGLLFYPCTVAVSCAFNVLTGAFIADRWPVILVSTLLGAALAFFGATLACGKAFRTQGE